jgi:hypothetical protein
MYDGSETDRADAIVRGEAPIPCFFKRGDQIPETMKLDHDVDSVANGFANFPEWLQTGAHPLCGGVISTILSCTKWNGQIFMAEMPLSSRLSARASARYASKSLNGPFHVLHVPVGCSAKITGQNVPVASTSVIDP